MRTYFRNIVFIISACCLCNVAKSQVQDTLFAEAIAVAGRPYPDSIVLRWAPLQLSVWQQANKNGYLVERYVMARNGTVLTQPERTILTPSPIKPLPESQWEALVKQDKYAAIAAQALFGDRFEVDLSKSDIFTIVNKVKENEQRFAFALFSADMSPSVAKASGLWFTDKNVKKGEKYLYRIIVDQSVDGLKGSIFISPDDQYNLSKPLNLKAEFKDQTVSLRWDKSGTGKYTAYILERSTNGKIFTSISDTPLVTVSPTDQEETRYEYAIDSVADVTKTYSYRVKGVTPFGELSVPSDVVSGKGTITIDDVPYITKGENIDNKSIHITWDFPEKSNTAIKGFNVERSPKPQGNYISLTLQSPISPTMRSFEDKNPQQVNYYRVTALGLNGEKFLSPVYLAQLVDSIPPAMPEGLKAVINEFGSVELTWVPNKDQDIYGYRVYRANEEKEELSQITNEPIINSSYTDRVNLNTLNGSIYYSVMAIDKNQNHSQLSSLLKVALPDKIKPQPPVFLPVKSNEKGVVLSWMKSSSEDVVQYDLYRKAADRQEWQRIKIAATADTIYYYTDEEAGKMNSYTVTAVDEAGLESDPAAPVSAGKIDNGLRSPIKWKEPVILKDQKEVVLTWEYDQPGVRSFRIYKALDEDQSEMYRTVTGDTKEFKDKLITGKKFKYQILVIFENGNKSLLSKEILINF